MDPGRCGIAVRDGEPPEVSPAMQSAGLSTVRELVEEQRLSNLSAVPHFDTFAGHRQRLTAAVSARHVPGASERLCVLGAGNAYDLDLSRLAEVFREIHLVDIDEAALARAYARQDPATQARLFLHAPLDLSGLFGGIEAWRDFRVTPDELAAYPEVASARIASSLPGPFDVVVSTCVLTQLQLSVLSLLSASHGLFEATRQLLNVMHLRTLAKLLVRNGRALLVSDLSSNLLFPLSPEATDLQSVLVDVLSAGKFFYAAHPDLLQWASREDPVLRRTARVSPPVDVWLWQNGAARTYLVYALELERIA
jgi:hypothetical protein